MSKPAQHIETYTRGNQRYVINVSANYYTYTDPDTAIVRKFSDFRHVTPATVRGLLKAKGYERIQSPMKTVPSKLRRGR